MRALQLTGQVFGRLTVLYRDGLLKGQSAWVCQCECGERICVPASYLRTGDTKSCGCLQQEHRKTASVVHGHTSGGVSSSTRNSWRAMHERCRLPSHPQYKNYGGRGISVCERWKDFSNFLADMDERPPGLTLDRIDVNGNYEASNCRWADRATQMANRRPRTRANAA